MTDPADALDWVCNHQAVVLGLLALMPAASALTWFTGFYQALPAPIQFLLHIAAGNLLHAFADPPKGADQ